tara:strand:+ start:323 stop:541 length:219 start_codon:yes stop_codon:yes gene_type:complete
MRKTKRSIPKRHKVRIGACVQFKHAGRTRHGEVVELTKQADGHATYTVVSQGIIYPQLGLNGSKWIGYVIVE